MIFNPIMKWMVGSLIMMLDGKPGRAGIQEFISTLSTERYLSV